MPAWVKDLLFCFRCDIGHCARCSWPRSARGLAAWGRPDRPPSQLGSSYNGGLSLRGRLREPLRRASRRAEILDVKKTDLGCSQIERVPLGRPANRPPSQRLLTSYNGGFSLRGRLREPLGRASRRAEILDVSHAPPQATPRLKPRPAASSHAPHPSMLPVHHVSHTFHTQSLSLSLSLSLLSMQLCLQDRLDRLHRSNACRSRAAPFAACMAASRGGSSSTPDACTKLLMAAR